MIKFVRNVRSFNILQNYDNLYNRYKKELSDTNHR